MRSRLFLKIYATLLVCLVLAAASSALFARLAWDDADGWHARRDRVIAAVLPPASDPAALQSALDRLGEALDADITVFDAEGVMLAHVGKPAPADLPERLDGHERIGRPFRFATRLADGRVVAARIDPHFDNPDRGRNLLLFIALITGVTALAAYPVVRHLTRRLERLRGGVEAWGAGDLRQRVDIAGRDEVAAVAQTFNQAADTVERLVRSHGSLLANASHELRSPLARMRMALDLYEGSGGTAARDEILRSLGELDDLVEEILLASRLDHAGDAPHSEQVDLLALAAEEGAREDVAIAGEAALVKGDPRLLRRLVRNLLQNARKHGAPPVEATVRRTGGVVELSVRDHGPGVPEIERDRIFEPFYRPGGASEVSGGWGLGLALVRQIALRHGAVVGYEAPPNGGARFVVRFPG
ncbi:sensor histidine kinase [Hansschlegelia zhihuaiae]|uniref:histidine kinase n=1 Tax=Hansschlegelia zhihuaiae TaxID=405005 RepID=A0A4Q0MM45_9HYPH|nr:HAMP domain-containing sensor histidine kinase [Hansschlegelia zhihuaiae]RXF74156.1 HAMP domain-containing histidine kinase [Hansschlegelia zhihuaiae]